MISDVHANLVALRAVLAEIDALGLSRIVCAGDVVGFGPDPDAVVDVLRERSAEMIRGNHEKDYVARFDAPDRPGDWRIGSRYASFWWSMERLGSERRAYLAALPDILELDDGSLVVHGSPKHVRDAVLARRTDEELAEAMFADVPHRRVFMGHTHRPLVRDLPRRRLVNVGSVGLPLDGDTRACFVLVDGDEVEIRRVPYDVEAAIARYEGEGGLRETGPAFVAIFSRTLRCARDYFGPFLRQSADVPDAEYAAAMLAYLDANP